MKRLVVAIFLVTVAACDPPPPPLTDVPFDSGQVRDVDFIQPTALTFGSDGRLYVSELGGRIVALSLTEDGRAASMEVIAEESMFNQVLGLAYADVGGQPALYVSHNYISQSGDGPFANEIIRLIGPDLSEPEPVITGLPVSGHNHGTNDLEFGPDGRLYIAQGGTTSSGAPAEPDDARWRDWDESPLSGAILVAEIDAPEFDGEITYDSELATRDTNMIGGDVSVFSPGHRNTYDILFHSNGHLYSVDNGSSEPVPASLDCDTLGPPPDNDPDQLNLVVEGAYYGHANRNRGREEPRQCENVSPFDESEGDGMLLLVPPSSNSLLEVTEGVFPEDWHGDLLLGWWTGGQIRRLRLSDGGQRVEGQEIVLDGLGAPIAMATDPATGIIYVAEFGAGAITYLAPAS